jgi:DNA-binding transcriptional LysR family regulator
LNNNAPDAIAAALDVSQPTISRAMQEVERIAKVARILREP